MQEAYVPIWEEIIKQLEGIERLEEIRRMSRIMATATWTHEQCQATGLNVEDVWPIFESKFSLIWKDKELAEVCFLVKKMLHGESIDEEGQARAEEEKKPPPEASGDPMLIRASEVTEQPIRWLWKNKLAIGKLTLLVGDPCGGKSLLSNEIAARISRGTPMPFETTGPRRPSHSVLILSAEDGLEDTICPRLRVAGANLDKIEILKGVLEIGPEPNARRILSFNLQRDLRTLELALQRMPDCKLVVVDPISAYMGKTDSNADADVRGVLAPFTDVAERYGVAILAIKHLNKAIGGSAMHRAGGSIAFIAASRMAWMAIADPKDELRQQRLFLCIKNNLGPQEDGLSYEIMPIDEQTAMIKWTGNTSAHADEVLNSEYGVREAFKECVEWLRKELSGGPVEAATIFWLGDEAGYSEDQIRRASKKLSVKKKKDGDSGKWFWELPEDEYPRGRNN